MTEGLNERYCLHDHVRWPVSVDEALRDHVRWPVSMDEAVRGQGQPLNRGLKSD
jgi:hypothetical protein